MELPAKLPASRHLTLLPYQVPQVRKVLFEILKGEVFRILDMTAHIGGDAINLSQMYATAHITAIDVDAKAIEHLRENIRTNSDPTRFTIIHGDSVGYVGDLIFRERDLLTKTVFDLVYIDCPWGLHYCDESVVFLFLGGKPIAEIVNKILDVRLAKNIVLKVPRNFGYPQFISDIRGKTRLYYIRKPQKQGNIAYGLVHIQPLSDETR